MKKSTTRKRRNKRLTRADQIEPKPSLSTPRLRNKDVFYEAAERAKLREELIRQGKDLRHDLKYINKHLDKLWEHVAITNTRLYHLEAQVNLISRLITTLCIEKFGLKLKTFRRLVQRIEKEAIADSEIRDLQELFEREVDEKE
jgi:hypothetical protein